MKVASSQDSSHVVNIWPPRIPQIIGCVVDVDEIGFFAKVWLQTRVWNVDAQSVGRKYSPEYKATGALPTRTCTCFGVPVEGY